jgi:galactokinase
VVPVPRGLRRLSSEDAARQTLAGAFGPGGAVSVAQAPGRCTIVGEHIDYAGGLVLCAAINLGVAVAVRASPDARFRVASAGRRVERSDAMPVGDIGDRIFAAAVALRDVGIKAPAFEAGVAATLPEGAGLASSAAVVTATIAVMLRLTGQRMDAARLATAALHAERDIVGVPCGPLDHRAVVFSEAQSVGTLDCASLEWRSLPWPWPELVICACDTGERHDVGGRQYRARREETEHALDILGVDSCQQIDEGLIERSPLSGVLAMRARHVYEENQRSHAAVQAIQAGDAPRLGALMTASHRSLHDLHEVSTPALDSVVAAALASDGCLGARLTGAGFGGSVIALVDERAAGACRATMAAAAHRDLESTWVFRPAAGVAALLPDVVGAG